MANAQTIDRRPTVVEAGGEHYVAGLRCTTCRYPITQPVPRCPECCGVMAEDRFGPAGVVAASTCLRVRVPGYDPPYAIAYVDLDEGPRVFVHTPDGIVIPVGTRVTITGETPLGDIAVSAQTQEAAA